MAKQHRTAPKPRFLTIGYQYYESQHKDIERRTQPRQIPFLRFCSVQPIAPSTYYAHAARKADPALRSARAKGEHRLSLLSRVRFFRPWRRVARGSLNMGQERSSEHWIDYAVGSGPWSTAASPLQSAD